MTRAQHLAELKLHLRDEEFRVAVAAEKIFGGTAEPWDVSPRQNEVDIRLNYPDGRKAALEVTYVTLSDRMKLESVLSKIDYQLPAPPDAAWLWVATIESYVDLRRLRASLPRIIRTLEAHGVWHPDKMWQLREANSDIAWLLGSTVTLIAQPKGPVSEWVYVMPAGRGGAVDHSHAGLNTYLDRLFKEETSHVNKVTRDPSDERHLCFIIDASRAPFAVSDAISRSPDIPSKAPPMPEGLTHLWLMGRQYGGRILIWSQRGWSAHDQAELLD